MNISLIFFFFCLCVDMSENPRRSQLDKETMINSAREEKMATNLHMPNHRHHCPQIQHRSSTTLSPPIVVLTACVIIIIVVVITLKSHHRHRRSNHNRRRRHKSSSHILFKEIWWDRNGERDVSRANATMKTVRMSGRCKERKSEKDNGERRENIWEHERKIEERELIVCCFWDLDSVL